MAAKPKAINQRRDEAWRGFEPGSWQTRVNLRDFIQRNYTPYEGDSKFLQGATARTKGLWQKLQPLLAEEREKGILDVSQVPSSITAWRAHRRLIESSCEQLVKPARRASAKLPLTGRPSNISLAGGVYLGPHPASTIGISHHNVFAIESAHRLRVRER